jgi:amino acid transporter/nucleotide-binding universal stress UspA family protein
MIVSHQERPRELKWYHAGPMLYGDWGTSRFYVLGLAFYFALFSSFYYILGVGILVAAVGWAYTVVCRVYPDGGGVYSAARQISPLLSVIGALLLFADYAVTAALSAFDGWHYFGLESGFAVKLGACLSILFLGFINYIGPKRAGTFALVVAAATLVLTLILVGFSIPHLADGWRAIQPMESGISHRWITLVNVVLALSGVEAVANMTGIMVLPVSKTAKKSIWPVLIEVVGFNLVLAIAMLALPGVMRTRSIMQPGEFQRPASLYEDADEEIAHYRDANPDWDKDTGKTDSGIAAYERFANRVDARAKFNTHSGTNEEDMKNKVLRVMGEVYVHRYFGIICGFVFGLLLISAVNTVIGGMMSVAYVMARDTELPHAFTRLNLFGVPWIGLIPALLVPILLLCIFNTLETLADLYAIGVVGAIAINLTCCTINKKLPVKLWERLSIGAIAAVMIAIELTLAVEKPHALYFVVIILAVGLGARLFTKSYLPARARMKAGPTPEQLTKARYRGVEVPTVAPPARAPVEEALAFGTAPEELDMSKPHLMVATRGGQRLLTFAADYAKQMGAILFVLYVRQWNVQFAVEGTAPTLEEDKEAQNVFRMAEKSCKEKQIPMVPIYVVSRDVADSILDFAATYDVRALLMGVSRQGTLLRALRGDVLASVADQLPQDIPLLIHA